jgi:hypothetical protein
MRRLKSARHHDSDEGEEAMRHNTVQLDIDDSEGYLQTKYTMTRKILWGFNEK